MATPKTFGAGRRRRSRIARTRVARPIGANATPIPETPTKQSAMTTPVRPDAIGPSAKLRKTKIIGTVAMAYPAGLVDPSRPRPSNHRDIGTASVANTSHARRWVGRWLVDLKVGDYTAAAADIANGLIGRVARAVADHANP